MDEASLTGCLIEVRLIGVIEAEETEDGKAERNGRLIAVATESPGHQKVKSLRDLDPAVIKEIEHFFVSYNQEKGRKFKPISRPGPQKAERLVSRHVKHRK